MSTMRSRVICRVTRLRFSNARWDPCAPRSRCRVSLPVRRSRGAIADPARSGGLLESRATTFWTSDPAARTRSSTRSSIRCSGPAAGAERTETRRRAARLVAHRRARRPARDRHATPGQTRTRRRRWCAGRRTAAKDLPGINALVGRRLAARRSRLLALDPRVTSISLDTPVLAIDGNLVAPLDGATDDDAPLRAAMGLGADDAGRATASASRSSIPASRRRSISSDASPRSTTSRAAASRRRRSIRTATARTSPASSAAAGCRRPTAQLSRRSARNARLIGLRVLDENGAGETSR